LDDVEEHNQFVGLDLVFPLDDHSIHQYEFLKYQQRNFLLVKQVDLPASSSACSSSNFVSTAACASTDDVGVAGLLQIKLHSIYIV
jgi:hypothetical protein